MKPKISVLVALVAIFLAVVLVFGCTQKAEKKQNLTNISNITDPTPANSTTNSTTNITNSTIVTQQTNISNVRPPSTNNTQILIGVEYATSGMAKIFAELGIPAVKYYPDAISWDNMQPSENSRIDFSVTDEYVREYQGAGFSELVIALKSRNRWASKNFNDDYTPADRYVAAYEKWVQSIVERYDMDGKDDMPGLKAPVRFFEIGTEFSSYEPESVDEYTDMLERAYRAAHNASGDVVVIHAAFLTTTAFKNNPGPGQYDADFAAVDKRIMWHSLADIRKILDRPDIFDAVNFHALGDSNEIESNVKWLDYEMQQRGYRKPVVIGDTATSPFVAWGAANVCNGLPKQMGILVPPATESDRCRLADYFERLLDGDNETVRWTQSFAAADNVKKVVVSASQGVVLIDVAFMEDLYPLKLKALMASAGTSPWSGMVQTTGKLFTKERTVVEYRPAFFALKQLAANIDGYDSVERISMNDSHIRLYKFSKDSNSTTVFVAWLEPDKVVLPGEAVPNQKLSLETNGSKSKVTRELMISNFGQQRAERHNIEVNDGQVEISITPTPEYIFVDSPS